MKVPTAVLLTLVLGGGLTACFSSDASSDAKPCAEYPRFTSANQAAEWVYSQHQTKADSLDQNPQFRNWRIEVEKLGKQMGTTLGYGILQDASPDELRHRLQVDVRHSDLSGEVKPIVMDLAAAIACSCQQHHFIY